MGTARIVRLVLLICDGLLVTAAVIVTEVPIGTTDGAVYVVAAPLEVCAGARVPQAPLAMDPVTGLPPQVTVQSTPALLLSPIGVMLNVVVPVTLKAVTVEETAPALALAPEVPLHPVFNKLSRHRNSVPDHLRTRIVCLSGTR